MTLVPFLVEWMLFAGLGRAWPKKMLPKQVDIQVVERGRGIASRREECHNHVLFLIEVAPAVTGSFSHSVEKLDARLRLLGVKRLSTGGSSSSSFRRCRRESGQQEWVADAFCDVRTEEMSARVKPG